MLKEELKKLATTMVEIPSHLYSIIEEHVEHENGEGEAIFSWTKEAQDEGITINLDFLGNLTSLSIDTNDKSTDMAPLKIEENRERAEQLLLRSLSGRLKRFNLLSNKKT